MMSDEYLEAREISWSNFGKRITFYLPGMFRYDGEWGKYPAISITGKDCELKCAHCSSKILETMLFATSPEELINKCVKLDEDGNIGCLITGGSLKNGSLPWSNFIPAIKEIKIRTNLLISIHSGIIDMETALSLKEAGVDQALIDVIGDDETLRNVYHVDFGVDRIENSLNALEGAGIPIVPHIVVGIDYGKIKGEYRAIEIIKQYKPQAVVIVVLTPLLDTPMENIHPPTPEIVAEIIAKTRTALPNVPLCLGCARKRDNSGTDVLAVDCGVNRIALASPQAIKRAEEYGLEIEFQKTCCSIAYLG